MTDLNLPLTLAEATSILAALDAYEASQYDTESTNSGFTKRMRILRIRKVTHRLEDLLEVCADYQQRTNGQSAEN